MIKIGDQEAKEFFCGNMGVKEIIIGDTTVYTRPGGYFYIILESENDKGEGKWLAFLI